jgi:hypothetical protein
VVTFSYPLPAPCDEVMNITDICQYEADHFILTLAAGAGAAAPLENVTDLWEGCGEAAVPLSCSE